MFLSQNKWFFLFLVEFFSRYKHILQINFFLKIQTDSQLVLRTYVLGFKTALHTPYVSQSKIKKTLWIIPAQFFTFFGFSQKKKVIIKVFQINLTFFIVLLKIICGKV